MREEETKYTKGEWKVAHDTYVCAGTNYLAETGLDDEIPEDEARANARLMAASPDLLAIAVKVANGNFNQADVITEARAAIQKAQGVQ